MFWYFSLGHGGKYAEKLRGLCGYDGGAYRESTVAKLLPNIAIYCKTPMRQKSGGQVECHVINCVGMAFDSERQPDYRQFMAPRWHQGTITPRALYFLFVWKNAPK